MAKIVFGMNQSLDGYVDHDHNEFRPSPALFHHFVGQVRGLAGSVYGRRIYEVMRYWDEDRPEWDAAECDFAAAWRNQPKWVVSRSLESVGPNATLVRDNLEAVVRELKAERVGEIEVAGPELARSLTDLGLIDEYRLYLHPVVLGRGKPFFSGPRPPLRLVASDRIDEDVIRVDVRSCMIAGRRPKGNIKLHLPQQNAPADLNRCCRALRSPPSETQSAPIQLTASEVCRWRPSRSTPTKSARSRTRRVSTSGSASTTTRKTKSGSRFTRWIRG